MRNIILGLVFGLSGTGVVMGFADTSKIIGPENCAACHSPETVVWKGTSHNKAFEVIHRLPKAQEIASKMGVKRMRNEGVCLECHYTAKKTGRIEKAVSGVSCESCHGGARDWISMHHQKPAQEQAAKAGWIRGSNLYDLYSSCFGCHTAPNEKLINHAGHPAGSSFELVQWSQGQIRHRFYDGKTNPETSPEKLRILYVLGKSLELEYSLRGVALATANDTYGQKMALRIKSSWDALSEISKKTAIPELEPILAAVPKKEDGTSLSILLGKQAEYTAAADQIRESTKKFIAESASLDLSALDSLLPKSYRGTPVQ